MPLPPMDDSDFSTKFHSPENPNKRNVITLSLTEIEQHLKQFFKIFFIAQFPVNQSTPMTSERKEREVVAESPIGDDDDDDDDDNMSVQCGPRFEDGKYSGLGVHSDGSALSKLHTSSYSLKGLLYFFESLWPFFSFRF
jgi:hypothetical protein